MRRTSQPWSRRTSLPPARGDLRLLTFNTHGGRDGRDRLDPEATARSIQRSGADLVALQEVDRHFGARSEYADQPAWYAERLGMEVVYGPNLVLPPESDGAPAREYGIALLSRFPVREAVHRRYTSTAEGEEPRGFVDARIEHRDTTLHVITTHLSVAAPEDQAAEAAELAAHIDTLTGPVVLAGDFNALYGSRELAPLRDMLSDAWDAGRGWSATCGLRRIDLVLTSADVRALRSRVMWSRASDHLPVMADLLLER